MNKIIGIDPGLSRTGWGVIEVNNNNLKYVSSGIVTTNSKSSLPVKLSDIYNGLSKIIEEFKPNLSAIEETYVNINYGSSLKLAQARAIAILVLEQSGLDPQSYQAKQIKKTVSGYGGADKGQMIKMINLLLPQAKVAQADAADAIAIAVCHFSHYNFSCKMAKAIG
jgi:crossover junction endodeoxyribonuclease RuvC